jgi:hypothetical protein
MRARYVYSERESQWHARKDIFTVKSALDHLYNLTLLPRF